MYLCALPTHCDKWCGGGGVIILLSIYSIVQQVQSSPLIKHRKRKKESVGKLALFTVKESIQPISNLGLLLQAGKVAFSDSINAQRSPVLHRTIGPLPNISNVCVPATSNDLIVCQDEFISVIGKHAKEQRGADLRGDVVVAVDVGRNVESVCNIVDAVEAA